jgi:formate dehydrogenase iron-sulfur subunit
MLACPFNVPTFEWDKPIPYIRKCTMCEDRRAEGKEPACATACPTGALTFGERDELLQEARSRIRAKPNKYVDHIYGEKEVGGTSELYISPVPFEKLNFPTLGTEAISRYADVAMLAVPPTIVVAAAAMGGVYWFVKRRERLMGQEVAESPGEEATVEKEGQQDDS